MVDLDQILRGAGQIIDTGLQIAVGVPPGARPEDVAAADAYIAAQTQQGVIPPPRSFGDWWQLRYDTVQFLQQIRIGGPILRKLDPSLARTLGSDPSATAAPDRTLSQGALICVDPSLDPQNLVCQ